MTATNTPYSRIYHSIVDDPMFERVYDNDKALAAWLRMLLVADAMHPTSAPMPPKSAAVRLLIEVGLVLERPGNRYTIRGLAAERDKRSQSARNAAAVRWHSDSNARRDETSKDKTSSGANAPMTFMGYRPKPGDHAGQHPDCAVCAPLRKPA